MAISRAQVRSEAAESRESPLQINDRLQITIKGTDEEVPTTYLSRVENVSGEDVTIGWPTNHGLRAPVRENDVLLVSYPDRGGVLVFDARIVKRIQEHMPLLIVRTEGPVRRTQRREYVRVPAMLEVRLSSRVVKAKAAAEGKTDVNLIATRTVNISGGGFGIRHPASPQIGDIYDVRLVIPDHELLLLTAKVMRVESMVDPVKGPYFDIGFAFIQIREATRSHLVKYVFRFQQNSLAQE